MSVADEFASSQIRVKQLRKTPSNDQLLELYALYKQATVGDAQGSRPGVLDFKGRAKFDAWRKRQGTSKDAAMQSYVDLVTSLASQYGSTSTP